MKLFTNQPGNQPQKAEIYSLPAERMHGAVMVLEQSTPDSTISVVQQSPPVRDEEPGGAPPVRDEVLGGVHPVAPQTSHSATQHTPKDVDSMPSIPPVHVWATARCVRWFHRAKANATGARYWFTLRNKKKEPLRVGHLGKRTTNRAQNSIYARVCGAVLCMLGLEHFSSSPLADATLALN